MRRALPKVVTVALLSWRLFACEMPRARDAAGTEAPAATPRVPPSAAPSLLPAPDPTPVPAPPRTPALRFAGADLDEDSLLEQLSAAEPTSFKPVGSTSTVFRMRLKGAQDAAFKAKTSNRPHGPASEVAAYRLARCLGLDNVPPAISREVPAAKIHALLDPNNEARWPQILERMGVSDEGVVHGAAIHWIPVLADVGIDKQSGLLRAHEWLRKGGELPDARRSLAASLSTMLAFDYLIGNFDRFSGDNAMGDAQATLVYIRDHDQAFPIGMGERLHRRVLDNLLLAERFSRRFYASLQRFTRGAFEQELARDPEGARGRLLSERQIAELLDRRQTLLSHIESLIALNGEREVLVFP